MIFSSLREFFYKLYNIFLISMLLPMLLFIGIYYVLLTNIITPYITDVDAVQILVITFPTLALLALTIVHWSASARLKALSREPSLGIKLEEYLSAASLRLKGCVFSSVLMAVGLFFTNHQYFGIYFGVIILWVIVIWPSPRRVCKDLRLRKDEAELVRSKGEAFNK
jgi:hypothetical protein